ncbi:membrane hypothetical protein [Vibrio chagasii]|nr:membrane hypothetical protein [Vibrio chagasii]
MASWLISISVFIVFFSLLTLSICKYKRLVSDLFDPIFTYILFLIVFFLNNSLFFDFPFSNWTGVVIFVGSVFYIIGCCLKFKRLNSYELNLVRRNDKLVMLIMISTLFISIFILLVKLSFYGVTLNSYLSNMLAFHAKNIKSGGYFWDVFQKLNFFLLLFFMFIFLNQKPSYSRFFQCLVILILYNIFNLSHSRWDYIQVIIYLLIIWMVIVNKAPMVKSYWLLGIPLIPSIMIALNILRHGRVIDDDFNVLEATVQSLKGDSGPGYYLDRFVDYFISTDAYNHGIFVIYQAFALVPRVVWTDKPVVSSLIYYTFEIMGENPFIDGSTFTYTVFDFFGIYHFYSLAIGMLLFGMLSRYLYNSIYISKSVSFKVFCIIFFGNYINTLRGSFVDQIALLEVDVIILFLFYYFVEKPFFKKKINVE